VRSNSKANEVRLPGPIDVSDPLYEKLPKPDTEVNPTFGAK
jgi:hypothetical protein